MIDENGVKNYYFYGITQDNYRLIKFVKCLSTAELVAGASHDSHTTDYVEEGQEVGLTFEVEDIHVMEKMGF